MTRGGRGGNQVQCPTGTLELVSRFQWVLQHGEDSRVYVKLPPAKLLGRIFSDRGVKKYLTLHESVPQGKARPHTVTYRESPLQFARRMMEEQGWYFNVTRTRSGEKLVVGDGRVKGQFKMLPPVSVVAPVAGKWPGPAEAAQIEPWSESRAGGGVETNAFHWETPQADLSVARPGADENGRPQPGVYVYGNYDSTADGERAAKRRAERARAAAGGVTGVSGCVWFAPGSRVRLNGKEYLLTTVWHEARAGDGEVPATYLPLRRDRSSVTFRPPLSVPRSPAAAGRGGRADRKRAERRRTSWRTSGGGFSWFAFDRPHRTGGHGVLVRPGQIWSATDSAACSLRPVGSEVMVGFEGDLDRPVLAHHHNPSPAAGGPEAGRTSTACEVAGEGRCRRQAGLQRPPGKEAVELASRDDRATVATPANRLRWRLTLKVGRVPSPSRRTPS